MSAAPDSGAGERLCSAGLHPLSAYGKPARCGSCNRERALERTSETLVRCFPAVSPTSARAALERAAPTTKMLGKVAAHLATHPTALIDGDSAAPLPVARLIDALRAAGVHGLVDPCCMDCGQPKHLHYRVPRGRVCNACEKRRRPREPTVCAVRQALPARRWRDGRRLLLRPPRGALHGLRSQPQRPLVSHPSADLHRLRATLTHEL